MDSMVVLHAIIHFPGGWDMINAALVEALKSTGPPQYDWPDGQLLDASEIEWYNDPDDDQPIQPTSSVQEGHVQVYCIWRLLIIYSFLLSGQHSHPVHATTGTQLAEAIATEKLDKSHSIISSMPHLTSQTQDFC